MKLKRVITLGYPLALLPDEFRDEIGPGLSVSIKVSEEPPGEAPSTGLQIEWETVAQRWTSGEMVPVSLAEVPPDLLED